MVLNIAHRGGAGLRPENTLAAFRHALALGCDGAELDVQLTRDGKLVVFHDFRVNPEFCRAGDGTWVPPQAPLLRDQTAAEISRYDIGRPRPGSPYASAHPGLVPDDGARIPSLEEVIALVRPVPGFHLFVEIKSSLDDPPLSAPGTDIAETVVSTLRKTDFLARTVLVSFDWPALIHAKTLEPKLACWFSTGEKMQASEAAIVGAVRAAGGDGWFPHFSHITPQSAAAAKAAGLALGAWTVNDPAAMRSLIALGLDALCTDYPDRLRALQPLE